VTGVLALDHVARSFRQRRGRSLVRAVDGVSLRIASGETVGVVGESGCGKSTLARLALRLIEPSAGTIRFDGQDITHAGPRTLLPIRRRMQAVFQDPLASLNPAMTIGEILREPFAAHRLSPPGGVEPRILALLEQVGLPEFDLRRRPAEFSGGQLQRIAIARALALDPDLVVADEPTSALDPSIQAQIVNLLLQIQRARGIAYLIISHDLDVLGHVADRIAVMYLGTIVEIGGGPAVMQGPLHPYTQALLAAAPTLAARRDRSWQRPVLPGDPPNPAAIPAGCRFHPRCPMAQAICRIEAPPLRAIATGYAVACHFAPDETRANGAAIARTRLGAAAVQAPAPVARSTMEQYP